MEVHLQGDTNPFKDQVFGPIRKNPYANMTELGKIYTDPDTRKRVTGELTSNKWCGHYEEPI